MLRGLKEKLFKTRQAFRRVEDLFQSGRKREEILEDLSEALILADVGVASTEKIIRLLREKSRKEDSLESLEAALKEELVSLLSCPGAFSVLDSAPAVFMMVGVNGGGKTTSLAKLAQFYGKRGKTVMMVAADTFRAAAQEQLVLWGKRLNIPVFKGAHGVDPAAVVFDALKSFRAQGADLLLIDTAGRLHTRVNLMNELDKIKRIIAREIPGAPQEILLVLDATTGQNALAQAREFLKVAGLTGVFLAKLDGTARGGSVIGIVGELGLPVKFIGVGENEEDILEFSPREFVDALFS